MSTSTRWEDGVIRLLSGKGAAAYGAHWSDGKSLLWTGYFKPSESYLADYSRTPITLVVVNLDSCGRVFGSAPCLATGEPCYNTYSTCKYKSAFLLTSKDYEFTTSEAPLPFKSGERPYVQKISWLPTEIKDTLTIKARLKITLLDEPDTDVGVDPYVEQRASVQGTFWKKLLTRNRNYKGKTVTVLDGALGVPREEFVERFVGQVSTVTMGRGGVTIEVADLLASLDDIEVPPRLDIKLVTAINDAVTTMTLSEVEGLESPAGYIRIGDELISYTGVNASSNELTGCQRGHAGTTAEAHGENEKVQAVRYFAPNNPFEHMKTMLLTDAGIGASRVDTAEFDYWKDWPGGEVDFSSYITEPTKLSTLYFELIDLLDCKSWVGEDRKITIRRNLPNEPARGYRTITDEENITTAPGSVDLNDKSRVDRVVIYWDKSAIGKLDEPASYARIDLGADADALEEYGEDPEAIKIIFCRWLRSGYMQDELMTSYIIDLLARRAWSYRDAMPLLSFEVELKDSNIKTGEYARISTDELVEKDGSPLVDAPFIIVRRERQGDDFKLKALKLSVRKIDLIAPDDAPDWEDATDADKEYGYICDDDGLMPDGTPGYSIY